MGDALCWVVMTTMQVEMLGRYFLDIAVNPSFDYLILNISFLVSIIRADLTGCKRVLCMHHNVKPKDGTWKLSSNVDLGDKTTCHIPCTQAKAVQADKKK